MKLINTILTQMLKKRIRNIEFAMEHPHDVQSDILKKLVDNAKNTQWGKQYGYDSINSYSQFCGRVPISSYEEIFPYIERVMKGEQNILWPSKIKWFSKSSGTTNAKSKFIPVSQEALEECHYNGGKDLCSLYINNFPQTKMFDGKSLAIGGALYKNQNYPNTYTGDVSAVIMANLPKWAQVVRTPGLKVALMSEWEEKINKIASITAHQKVTNISGVPTWTMVLLEKILEITGKENMNQVWPQIEVFFHGAVAFHPYKEIFRKLFPEGLNYVETYNASEGFFGIQDRLNADDMLLMLNYGMYYEFIPFDDIDSESPRIIPLEQVEQGQNYAMVISTNAGLWRYKIGDTVKFTSIKPYRIKITGRTKHFINAFGEELIIDNADIAITKACNETSAILVNYTAAPDFIDGKSLGRHEWVIEFSKNPDNFERFVTILDNTLKEVNSDYEAKRYKDMALQAPLVHIAPENTFYQWMKNRGKLGGQNKVPRLANNREYIEDILSIL